MLTEYAPAQADDGKDPAGAAEGPILGCGKAQALAGRLMRARGSSGINGPTFASCEAAGDTDVLHYALDN